MSISDDCGADDRTQRRTGLSEALFREVNERIERLGSIDAGSGRGIETITIVRTRDGAAGAIAEVTDPRS